MRRGARGGERMGRDGVLTRYQRYKPRYKWAKHSSFGFCIFESYSDLSKSRFYNAIWIDLIGLIDREHCNELSKSIK